MNKTQEEANIYATKIASQAARHNQDNLSNGKLHFNLLYS